MIPELPRDDLHDWLPTDRPGRALLKWTRLLASHRWLLATVLILQAIVFSSFSAWIAWQPDILQFFSANSAEVRNVRDASQKPGLVNQLRFDVHINAPSPDDQQAVIAAAHALAAALRSTKQFRSVWTGANLADVSVRYAKLLPQAPLLLTAAQREPRKEKAEDQQERGKNPDELRSLQPRDVEPHEVAPPAEIRR